MAKKGISPIVATLLLVALVVTLSSVIFITARQFIGEVVTKNGMPAEQACEGISLSAIYSGGELQLTNNGDIPVHKFTAGVTSLSTGDFEAMPYEEAILAGGSASVSIFDASAIEITPWVLGENDEGQSAVFECTDKVFIAEIY